MSRRAATTTQANIARALRAAKQAGAARVRVMPDGEVVIELQAGPEGVSPLSTPAPVAQRKGRPLC